MVITTAPAPIRRPLAVTTPATRPAASSTRSSAASAADVKPRRRPQQRLHGLAVQLAVRLGAWAAHRRPLAAVQQLEMDAGGIGRAGHHAVQRIDLPHQMPLADPADGRVAGHLAERFDPMGQQQGAGAAACRRRRRLAAGMAAAHHHHVEDRVEHAARYSRPGTAQRRKLSPTRSPSACCHMTCAKRGSRSTSSAGSTPPRRATTPRMPASIASSSTADHAAGDGEAAARAPAASPAPAPGSALFGQAARPPPRPRRRAGRPPARSPASGCGPSTRKTENQDGAQRRSAPAPPRPGSRACWRTTRSMARERPGGAV